MSNKKDLFELIHTLSKREKQLFKLKSNSTNSSYLQLFDVLANLEDYEEDSFLQSDAGQAFRSNYPVRKNELYEKVLNVCRSQRQRVGFEKPIEFQAREKLEDVRYLRDKELRKQAFRRLRQAKKLAEQYELHELLIEILRVERFLIVDRQAPGYIEKATAIHSKLREVTEVLSNRLQLFEMKDRFFLVARQFAEQHGHYDQAYLKAQIDSEALRKVEFCLSFEAKNNFYFCHSLYYHLTGNPKKAWENFRSLYRLWLDRPDFIKIKVVEYRNILQNYLSFSIAAKEYEDYEKVLEALESGPFRSLEEEAATVFNVFNVRVSHDLFACNWTKLKSLMARFKEAEQRFGRYVSPIRIVYISLNFAWVEFVLGNFQESIYWLNRIENAREGNIQDGIVFSSKLLEIIVLFEAEDLQLFDSRYRSILAALSKLEKAHSFEINLVKQLNRNIGKKDSPKFLESMNKLYQELQKGDEIDGKHEMTRKWLLSKTKRRALIEIVEEEND